MRFIILSAIIVISLPGCTRSVDHWQHSSAMPSQVEQDRKTCEYQAKSATASASDQSSKSTGDAIGQGINIAETQIELTNECMELKGYTPG